MGRGFRNVSWSFAADNDYLYVAWQTTMSQEYAPMAQIYVKSESFGWCPPFATVNTDGSIADENLDIADAKVSSDGTTYTYEAKIARTTIGTDVTDFYVMGRYLNPGYQDAQGNLSFVILSDGQTPLSLKLPEYVAPVVDYKGHELTQVGQHHFFINADEGDYAYANTDETVNGEIAAGEYTWKVSLDPSKDATDTRFFRNAVIEDVNYVNIHATVEDGFLYMAVEAEDTNNASGGWADYLFGWLGHGDYTCQTNPEGRFILPRAGSQMEFAGAATKTPADIKTAGYSIDRFGVKTVGDVTTYEWRYDLSKYENADKLYFAMVYSSSSHYVQFGFETAEFLGDGNQKLDREMLGKYPHVFFLGEASELTKYGCVACAEDAHSYDVVQSLDSTNHRLICSVCGHMEIGTHTIVNSEQTKAPGYGVPGMTHHTCALCIGYDEEIPALTIPTDAHFLTMCGQKHAFISAAAEEKGGTPAQDGVISADEYNWWIDALDNDATYVKGDISDVSSVKMYANYDADYIYLATQTADSNPSNYGDSSNFYIGGGDETGDAIRIYMPRTAGGPELWEVIDGVYDRGVTADYATYVASYAYGVGTTYVQEIKIPRAAFNNVDKIFISIEVRTNGAGNIIYGFDSTEKIGDNLPLDSDSDYFSPYPHVFFFGAPSEFADEFTAVSLTAPDCTEGHSYSGVEYSEANHKEYCTKCGDVVIGEHTWSETYSYNVENASFGNPKKQYKACTYEGCEATTDWSVVDVYDPNAEVSEETIGKTTYTLWQNNIMQNYIKENNYGASTTGGQMDNNGDTLFDDKDSYYILPSATKEQHTRGASRYQKFYETLETYMPDVLGLQECDLGWHILLDEHDAINGNFTNGVNYGNYGANTKENGYSFTYNDQTVTTYPISKLGYASIYDNNPDVDILGVRVPIYYRTDKFECIESGIFTYAGGTYYEQPFSVSWAILKSLESGEYVAFTSTHVQSGNSNTTYGQQCAQMLLAKRQEIENNYKVPVISVGDYNALIGELAMNVYTDAGLKSGREDALELINGTWMTSGNALGARPKDATQTYPGLTVSAGGNYFTNNSNGNTSGSQIDHCFYSINGIAGDIWDVRIDDNSYADHVPALFTFRVVGMGHECTAIEECAWTELDETTHYRKCLCNANYEEASHNIDTYTQNGDGVSHNGTCADCNATVTVACTANADGYTQGEANHTFTCGVCEGAVAADHNIVWTSTGNTAEDTHTKACDICGYTVVATTKHTFDAGVMTTPATFTLPGKREFNCECGAKYVLQYVTDAHFIRGTNHLFAGSEIAVAPSADGVVNSAEYSWTSGKMNAAIAQTVDSMIRWHCDGLANTVTDYVAYDDEYVYVALVSSLEGDYAAVARPATESVRIFLGANDNWNSMVGVNATYTHATGAIAATTVHYQALKPWDGAGYNNIASVDNKTAEYVTKTDASACLTKIAAKYDASANALVYELVLDRTALATACGADAELDRLFFQTGATGIKPDGTASSWHITRNGYEYRGVNYVYESAARENGVENAQDFLYINGTFPQVIFLSTKAAQDSYLADNADHSGWNKACTAHNYRLVYAGNNTHKEVCNLCGAENDAVACTMSDWVLQDNDVHAKSCSVCNYVATEGHTLGEVTSGNNGTHSQVCSVCTGTVTNTCSGDWTTTETTHTTVCDTCGYEMSVEEHEFTYTSTGTSASDTHTGTCDVCGYVAATATHTFDGGVADPAGSYSVKAFIKYTCTVCKTSYRVEYVPDGHLLTAYFNGQKHFFAGLATSVAPEMDGVIGDSEYSFGLTGMDATTTESIWSWRQTAYNTWTVTTPGSNVVTNIGIYMGYDDEYIYLAGIMESANAPTVSRNMMFRINPSDKASYSTATMFTATYNPNGNHTVITAEGKKAVTAADYKIALNQVDEKYNLVSEIKISRSALAEAYGIDSFNKLYVLCEFNLWAADGTGTGIGSFLWAASGNHARDTIMVENGHADGNSLDRASHVLFLGSNNDFADYLGTVDDNFLGSYYKACVAHSYRTVIASATGHINVCQLCGQTETEVEAAHTYGAWSELDGKHARTCTACGYVDSADHAELTAATTNNNGTHTGICSVCNLNVTVGCSGDWTQTETTHKTTCTLCGYVMSEENHEWSYTSTGNTATDTHTKTCTVCNYVAAENVTHSFTGAWTTAGTTTTVGKKTYSCECGASYVRQEVGDAHFARNTPHFFVGNPSTVVPNTDGILNAAEYNWMSTAAWGSRASAATNTPRAYVSYDGDYIYIAVTSTATAGRPASEEVRVYLGGSDSISRMIGFKGVFANGTLTTDMLYFNTTKTVLTCNYNIQDTHASTDSALDALATACLVKSAAKLDTATNTLVYEIVIDRTALATACGADAELNRLYFQPAVTGINASGAVDSWLMIKNGYDVRGTNTFYNKNDRVQGVENAEEHTYINGLFPGVIFLSTKVDQNSYLANNAEHTGWNTACTAHNYRLVYAGNNTHKNVCSLCGAEETAVACTMSNWAAVEGESYHAKTCNTCGYVVKEVHAVTKWTDNKNGTHTGTCNACGGGEITANCDYGTWTKVDEATHGKTCSYCGNTVTGTHTSTGAGTIVTPAKLSADGTKSFTCTTCNTAYTKSYSTDDGYYFLINATGSGMNDVTGGAMKHFFLGNAMTKAPKLDGVIGDGEYNIEIYGPNKEKFTVAGWNQFEDGFNRFKTNCQTGTKTDSATTYMAYDATNIYLAYAVHTDAATIGNQQLLAYVSSGDLQKDAEQTYTLNGKVAGNSGTSEAYSYVQTYVADADGVGGTMYYELVINREILVDKYDTDVDTADVNKFFYRSFIYCYNDAGTTAGYILHCPTWDQPVVNGVDPVGRNPHAIYLGTKASFADELTAGAAIFGATYDTTCSCSDDTFRLVMGEATHKEVCYKCGAERNEIAHAYDNACDATCNTCAYTRTVADHVYDNACDADCNECGATRTVADHVYDNACDADCNVCGATRTAADHVYDNACDADCNVCGATRTVGDHVYDDEYDTDCNECGFVRDDAACAHANKTTTEENRTEATCTTDGSYVSVVTCDDCGEELSRDTVTIDKLGHTELTEKEAAVAATCTTAGKTAVVGCDRCDYTEGGVVIDALGHTDGDIVVENNVPATCGEAGSYDNVVYCVTCKAELSRNKVVVEATGEHVYATETDRKNATCTEDGYVTMACGCGETQTTVLEKTGHTPASAVRENVVNATCGTAGSYQSVVKCSVCGTELSRTPGTIPATGAHNYGYSDNTGDTHTKTCSVCGVSATEDHTYNQGVCVCGKTAACAHEYVTEVTAPTCTKGGYTTYTCSKCGDTYKGDATAATGHNYDDGVVTTEALCYKTGIKTLTCETCGAKTTETIAKVAHDYAVSEDMGGDSHKFTCNVCSVTRTERHNFVGGVCDTCGAKPETIFELTEQGQKHDYVGEATTDAPTLEDNKDSSFDTIKDKYKEVAKVEPKQSENENEDKIKDKDAGFFYSKNYYMNVDYFKIYLTYDANKLYLAAEIDDKAFTGRESVTFTLGNGRGGAKVKLGADNETFADNSGVVRDRNVFVSDGDNENHKIVVYAFEIDLATFGALTELMTDGENVSVGQLTVSAENEDFATNDEEETPTTATYGVEIEEEVEGVAAADEVIGHAFTLRDVDNDSSINITNPNQQGAIDVFGTYVVEDAPEVISVSLTWEVPVFTYTAQYKWNADLLTDEIDTANSYWSENPAVITVVNHSNQAIEASFSFVDTFDDITLVGKFTTTDSITAEGVTFITLDSAALYNEAVSDTVYFYVTDGELPEEHTAGDTIGNITITIGAVN